MLKGFCKAQLCIDHGTPQAADMSTEERVSLPKGDFLTVPCAQDTESPNALVPRPAMRLVCVSDTHGAHRELALPSGDVLVHAGDFRKTSTTSELLDFVAWLHTVKEQFDHIIVIAGNHDMALWESWADINRGAGSSGNDSVRAACQELKNACDYLEDQSLTLESKCDIACYGTTWQPFYGKRHTAFISPPGDVILEHWKKIPDAADILVVHKPPFGRPKMALCNYLVGSCWLMLAYVRHVK